VIRAFDVRTCTLPPTPLDPTFHAALRPETDPLPCPDSEIIDLAARDHLPAPA
jgi:hypothetical protein